MELFMREPLYRQRYDAATLLRDHPPQFRHPHKSALYNLAYPAGSGTQQPVAIEVTRWAQHVQEPISLAPPPIAPEVRPDFYDYRAIDGGAPQLEWHINFADPRLFVA